MSPAPTPGSTHRLPRPRTGTTQSPGTSGASAGTTDSPAPPVRLARLPETVGDDDRISLVFRVGVTGHRWIRTDDENAQGVVGAALEDLFARCDNRSTDWTPVEKAVVSSLAEGADRLAAAWALQQGWRLEVVLPMEREAYVADFATEASRTEFRHLISAAHAVTVVQPSDTSRAPTLGRSPSEDDSPRVRGLVAGARRRQASAQQVEDAYRAAGEAVVERSDVLLAVWDGRRAKGIGGTAEVVAAAGRSGLPVSWLCAERYYDRGPTFVPADVRCAAIQDLPTVPDKVVLLSPPAMKLLDKYNKAKLPSPPAALPGPPDDPAVQRLSHYQHRADLMAVRAQKALHRAVLEVYTLAVVAVALAAGRPLLFPEQEWLGWVEVLALFAITGILLWGHHRRFLDRWLATRILAERLRSGCHLARIGAAPVLGTPQSDAEASSPATESARRAVREAVLRAGVAPSAHMDLEAGRSLLLEKWLQPQLDYHQEVARTARTREVRSTWVTIGLFIVSLVAALAHVLHVLESEGAGEYWTFLAVVVPAAAAAVSGYTAHREYVRRHLRSARMVQRLTEGRASVLRATTASELRRAAVTVDLVMHGESIDWFAATRLHELRLP
jgi:hypothetical protein